MSLCVTSSSPTLQCKTYACIMESHLMGLTVDFSMGFVCFDAASKVGAGQAFVVNKNGESRSALCDSSNKCIVHSGMKLTQPQPRVFLFFSSSFFYFFQRRSLILHCVHFGTVSTFVLTAASLQLKHLTPACSSFWPFPKSERHADDSAGAHYVDEQDTSAAILFSKNLAVIPAV